MSARRDDDSSEPATCDGFPARHWVFPGNTMDVTTESGRVGRLLIALLLCNAGVLRQPLLYLSLYFKQHRSDYYDHVRRTGDWEAWLAFFLEGVRVTAESAVATSRRLVTMFASDRTTIEQHAGRRTGSALRVSPSIVSARTA